MIFYEKDNKLVSVLISVFNAQETISNSLNSILNQTYKNIEILIMDDCSTDNSFDILNSFQLDNNNVKIYKNSQNLGLTKSLNKLVDMCNGDIIVRHDIDDYSVEKRIEKQVKALSRYKLDFCLARATRMDTKKPIPRFSFYLPDKFVIKYKNPFIHGTLAINKDVLLKVGKYDEDFYFAQDYKLFSDLLANGFKYKVLNESLYYLNMKNNISSNNKNEQKYYAKFVQNKTSPKK